MLTLCFFFFHQNALSISSTPIIDYDVASVERLLGLTVFMFLSAASNQVLNENNRKQAVTADNDGTLRR